MHAVDVDIDNNAAVDLLAARGHHAVMRDIIA